jgi:hypothetical protein
MPGKYASAWLRSKHYPRRFSALFCFPKPVPKLVLQVSHLGKQLVRAQGVVMVLCQGQLVRQVLFVAEQGRGRNAVLSRYASQRAASNQIAVDVSKAVTLAN